MTWKLPENFHEDLQHDFLHYWADRGAVGPGQGIPDALFVALKESVEESFAPKLVHPLDEDGVVFLAVGSIEEALLVRFEPPATTTVRFLGSLAGGTYTESVIVEEGKRDTVGTFEHDRCGKFEVTLGQPPDPRAQPWPEDLRAYERRGSLLAQFKVWAMRPPQSPT